MQLPFVSWTQGRKRPEDVFHQAWRVPVMKVDIWGWGLGCSGQCRAPGKEQGHSPASR